MVKTILNLKSDKKKNNNKKIISLTLFVLYFFGSCTFLGESMFPVAMSPDISDLLSSGSIEDFYILDNGDEELLFLIIDTGVITAAVFDTSLNYRSYLVHDGSTIILNDGPGFVDFNNNFIVGDEVLENDGSGIAYGYGELDGFSGYSVRRYIDTASINSYFYFDDNYTGSFYFYEDDWASFYTTPIDSINTYPSIDSAELNTDSFDLFDQSNNTVYQYQMDDIFTLKSSAVSTPITLDESNLTEWITRCDEGYFVSNYSGEFFLFDFDGEELKSIDHDDEGNQVCTIDNNGEYYYYIDENNGYIVKKRLSSW